MRKATTPRISHVTLNNTVASPASRHARCCTVCTLLKTGVQFKLLNSKRVRSRAETTAGTVDDSTLAFAPWTVRYSARACKQNSEGTLPIHDQGGLSK